MSKTIGTILEVAGFAALAVFTAGAGIAVAGGATIGAGLGAAASGIATLTGLSAATVGSVAAGLIVGAVGDAFGPRAPKPAQTETSLKSPTPERVSGYGRHRTDVCMVVLA